MGSPNDGNDPWPSCIVRFEVDETFKRGMLAKEGDESAAREYLKKVDAAVRKGAGEGTQHWSIADRRDYSGEQQRYRLSLIDAHGAPVSHGISTPAIRTHTRYTEMKGFATKGKEKGKGKRNTGKNWIRPSDRPERPPQQDAAAISSDPASARTAYTATPAVVEAPVSPPLPTRPRMFMDNDDTSTAHGTAPARAAIPYDGSDVRRHTRPPPAQSAPATQPYYHASSVTNRAPEGRWRSQSSTQAQPQPVVPGYGRDQVTMGFAATF